MPRYGIPPGSKIRWSAFRRLRLWLMTLAHQAAHPTSTLTRPRRPSSRRKRALAGPHFRVYRMGADAVVSFGPRRTRHSLKWLMFHTLIGIGEMLKL